MQATRTAAAIYVRISQDREGAGLGIQRQEEDCREHARRLGWTVGNVFVDNDVSAYSGKARPGYTKLMAAVESGMLGGVLAWHPDRLHRSPKELEHYIDVTARNDVKTETVRAGHWDLSTPEGRMVARQLGAVARFESEHKGARIKRARQQQALAGGWHGGMRPYGFEKDGVTVRPSEANEIARAVESTAAGVSLRSLVRDLNERQVPTATGRSRWTSQALRDMMLRPRIAGLSSYLGEVVGPAVWPAVVDEEIWRAACAVLQDPSRRTNRKGAGIQWLGSGLYRCGVCQNPTLRVGTTSQSRRTYRCGERDNGTTTGHVTREANSVDTLVEETIVLRLSVDKSLPRVLSTESPTIDLASLHAEYSTLALRLETSAASFADGRIPLTVLEKVTADIEVRMTKINEVIATAACTSPLSKLVGINDVAAAWFGEGDDRIGGFSLGTRRAILDALVVVTILPAPRGPKFRPEYVHFDWKV